MTSITSYMAQRHWKLDILCLPIFSHFIFLVNLKGRIINFILFESCGTISSSKLSKKRVSSSTSPISSVLCRFNMQMKWELYLKYYDQRVKRCNKLFAITLWSSATFWPNVLLTLFFCKCNFLWTLYTYWQTYSRYSTYLC